ncbi:MAG: hypothetical protein ABSF81_17450 [Bacteroidales bacterium]
MTALANRVIIGNEPEIVPSGYGLPDNFGQIFRYGKPSAFFSCDTSSNFLVYSSRMVLPDNSRNFIGRILSFKDLPENWDGYGAAKANKNAVSNAIDFIHKIAVYDNPIYFVAPGPNGEILIELKNEERSVEIYFSDDESDEVILIGNGKTVFEGSVSKDFNKIISFISIGEIV